jgi:hypothetical protein
MYYDSLTKTKTLNQTTGKTGSSNQAQASRNSRVQKLRIIHVSAPRMSVMRLLQRKTGHCEKGEKI